MEFIFRSQVGHRHNHITLQTNFMIWEKNNSIIIYKRMFNEEDLIEEEIYISNKEYDQKLGEFYNQIELKELEQDEQTN